MDNSIDLGIPGVHAWMAPWGWHYATWPGGEAAAAHEHQLKQKVRAAMAGVVSADG